MNRSIFSRAVAAGTLAFAVLASLPAHAGPFSALYVFGDSLSDNGNNAIAFGAAPAQVITGNSYVPSQAYASGTYSNGPVWATYFASMLGVPLAPSFVGGTDYAAGGATTGTAGEGPGGYPFSLRTQVGNYLTASGGAASSSALYVIAGGGNNARAALGALAAPGAVAPDIIGAAAAAFAADVGVMVDQLQAAGAQRILVWNTPNLGLAPAVLVGGSSAAAAGTFLAGAMNAALAGRLGGEVGVTTFDLFGFGSRIAEKPAAFGFINTADACGAIAGTDCSGFAYWDGIHPTTVAHSALASAVFAVAVPVPEPETWALMAVGLLAVGWSARHRQARAIA